MASRRIRLSVREPLLRLWATVGSAGRPPRDQSRKAAVVAVVLTFGALGDRARDRRAGAARLSDRSLRPTFVDASARPRDRSRRAGAEALVGSPSRSCAPHAQGGQRRERRADEGSTSCATARTATSTRCSSGRRTPTPLRSRSCCTAASGASPGTGRSWTASARISRVPAGPPGTSSTGAFRAAALAGHLRGRGGGGRRARRCCGGALTRSPPRRLDRPLGGRAPRAVGGRPPTPAGGRARRRAGRPGDARGLAGRRRRSPGGGATRPRQLRGARAPRPALARAPGRGVAGRGAPARRAAAARTRHGRPRRARVRGRALRRRCARGRRRRCASWSSPAATSSTSTPARPRGARAYVARGDPAVTATTRADAEALDRDDELAGFRERFVFGDEARIYADGNSLGRLPRSTVARLEEAVRAWGDRLVEGWPDWIELPARVGDRLQRSSARRAARCSCATRPPSTSTSSRTPSSTRAGATAPSSPTPRTSPPTATCSRASPHGRAAASGCSRPTPWPARRRTTCAVRSRPATSRCCRCPTSAYRSGALADMGAITAEADAAGVPLVWDLSHSAGAVPVELRRHGVRLAVGCTYKYLNAGPGAPAYLYVARRAAGRLRSPIQGWFGQREQFAMEPALRADGGNRALPRRDAPGARARCRRGRPRAGRGSRH